MLLIPNATNDWKKSRLFYPHIQEINKVVNKKPGLSGICCMKPLHAITGRLKKINPMSQSCRVRLFFGARLIQQNLRFEFFFACLIFFSSFYELACQNIQEKI